MLTELIDEPEFHDLRLHGTIHSLHVFALDAALLRPREERDAHVHVALLAIEGVQEATCLLDQEDVDTLYEFLGRYVTRPEEEPDGLPLDERIRNGL